MGANSGAPWSDLEESTLMNLLSAGLSYVAIAKKLGRTPYAIECRHEMIKMTMKREESDALMRKSRITEFTTVDVEFVKGGKRYTYKVWLELGTQLEAGISVQVRPSGIVKNVKIVGVHRTPAQPHIELKWVDGIWQGAKLIPAPEHLDELTPCKEVLVPSAVGHRFDPTAGGPLYPNVKIAEPKVSTKELMHHFAKQGCAVKASFDCRGYSFQLDVPPHIESLTLPTGNTCVNDQQVVVPQAPSWDPHKQMLGSVTAEELQQATKEHNMKAIEVKQVTMVNGMNADDLTTDQLYDLINEQEAEITKLSGLVSKPKKIKDEITKRQAGINALVAYLDGKEA